MGAVVSSDDLVVAWSGIVCRGAWCGISVSVVSERKNDGGRRAGAAAAEEADKSTAHDEDGDGIGDQQQESCQEKRRAEFRRAGNGEAGGRDGNARWREVERGQRIAGAEQIERGEAFIRAVEAGGVSKLGFGTYRL